MDVRGAKGATKLESAYGEIRAASIEGPLVVSGSSGDASLAKVTGNVTVASPDTLTLMPGVKLQFKSGVGLAVDGCLEAVGTVSDSIVFTAHDTTQRWNGIVFNGSSGTRGKLSYARVEYSQSSGIRVSGSSTSLTHVLVWKNRGGYGGGINISYGSPVVDHLVIAENISANEGGGLYIVTVGNAKAAAADAGRE